MVANHLPVALSAPLRAGVDWSRTAGPEARPSQPRPGAVPWCLPSCLAWTCWETLSDAAVPFLLRLRSALTATEAAPGLSAPSSPAPAALGMPWTWHSILVPNQSLL